jgi:hypothetical protein
MKVVYKPSALRTIDSTVAFIESKNTIGSGDRWVEKFAEQISLIAKSTAKFAPCKAPSLARYKYSCYTYKGWVIAFRATPKKFEVCRIIWGAYLNY